MLLKTAVIEKRLYGSNKLVLSVTCITKKMSHMLQHHSMKGCIIAEIRPKNQTNSNNLRYFSFGFSVPIGCADFVVWFIMAYCWCNLLSKGFTLQSSSIKKFISQCHRPTPPYHLPFFQTSPLSIGSVALFCNLQVPYYLILMLPHALQTQG